MASGLVVCHVSFSNGEKTTSKLRLEVVTNQSVISGLGLSLDTVEYVEYYDVQKNRYQRLDDLSVDCLKTCRIVVTLKQPSRSELLALPGRLFTEDVEIDDKRIIIAENGDGRANEGTGLVTWDASVVLAKALEFHRDIYCKGKHILELGAGTGVTGIAAAVLGASSVVVTDLGYVLDNLKLNVKANKHQITGKITVAELDWFRLDETLPKGGENWDVVLAADVVWVEDLVPGLVAALKATVIDKRQDPSRGVVLLAHQTRTHRTDEVLFRALERAGFSIRTIRTHPLFTNSKIKVYELKGLELPEGFVYLDQVCPSIRTSLRYATAENFCGTIIEGYQGRSRVILTRTAAEALRDVQQDIEKDGYDLVVYDAYRPQRTVDYFLSWSQDGQTNKDVKDKYWPSIVDKSRLFQMGYLATRSGHSRGSTVDLTIINSNASLNDRPTVLYRDCGAGQVPYLDDGTVDMFTSFDLFDACSGHDCKESIPKVHLQHRNYLRERMEAHRFKPLQEEWWHYTLASEPFPNTYFDF